MCAYGKRQAYSVVSTDLALIEVVLHRDTDTVLCQRRDRVVRNSVDDGRQKKLPDWQQAGRLSGREADETRRSFDETVNDARPLTCNLRLQHTLAGVSAKTYCKTGKGSPYSITEHRVPELIPVLGSQPADDTSHKPGGRLPLLSTGPAVTLQPLRGLAPVSLLGEQRHDECEQFA